ncbi:MAG: SLC13 family permease [Thermoguttaceae bacterium]
MLQITTLIVFVVTYFGLAVGHWFFLKLDRTGIALLGAIAMLALGCITLPEAVASVNMESILLLFALMVIAAQLHYAGFYTWIARKVLNSLLDRPPLFLAVLISLSGVLSAFLNNDVVVIAVAPVITVSLLEKKMNPVPFLIALALSSNIGCALTIIGNAQNVLVGEIGKISFGSYMLFAFVPVTLSLIVCYGVVYYLGRNSFELKNDATNSHKKSGKSQQNAVSVGTVSIADISSDTESGEEVPFNQWRTIKGTGILLILVFFFVFTGLPHYLVAMTGAGLLLCSHRLPSRNVLQLVNWQLLILFMGLFVVVGAFVQCGLADKMITFLSTHNVDVNNPLELTILSGVLSNCINNSAAVMLLVKVTDLTNPLNCYALALSNAFAGNLIIVGSLANIIAVQCAESFKLRITFFEFVKYGAPTAGISMLILLAWVWLFM